MLNLEPFSFSLNAAWLWNTVEAPQLATTVADQAAAAAAAAAVACLVVGIRETAGEMGEKGKKSFGLERLGYGINLLFSPVSAELVKNMIDLLCYTGMDPPQEQIIELLWRIFLAASVGRWVVVS